MKKLDNRTNEKGSITLFVLVAILFFIIVASFMYASGANKMSAQRKDLDKLATGYELSSSMQTMDKEYNNVLNNMKVKIILQTTSGKAYTSGQWTNESLTMKISYPSDMPNDEKYFYQDGQRTKYVENYSITESCILRVEYQGEVMQVHVKVDKQNPGVIFSHDGGNLILSTDNDTATLETEIVASDSESGVKKVEYAWNNSNTQEPDDYVTTENGTTVRKTNCSKGIYYLWTRVTDAAGNKITKVSKGFIVYYQIASDEEIKLTPSTREWTNEDVIVTVEYSDSLIENRRAGVGSANIANATSVTVTNNAVVCAEATNALGNKVAKYLEITNIDKTPPTIGKTSMTAISETTFHVNVMSIADIDGSGLKGYYYSTSDVTPTISSEWILSTESSFSFDATMSTSYYIWAIDNAGNISSPKIVTTPALNYSVDESSWHTTLQQAANASKETGSTIKVLQDVEGTLAASLVKSVTLNTNGKSMKFAYPICLDKDNITLTINGNGTITSETNAINNRANATLIADDVAIVGLGTNYPVIYNKFGGTIIVNAATVSSENSTPVYNNENGSVKIAGGSLTSINISALYNYSGGEIIVEDGILKVENANAVYNLSSGMITIKGGEIIGSNTNYPAVVNAAEGKIQIEGGTITSQNSYCVWNKIGGTVKVLGGTIKSVGSIAVCNQGSGEVDIENGELIAGTNTLNNVAGGTIRVRGGTISGIGNGYPTIHNGKEGSIEITGGTITSQTSYGVWNYGAGTVNVLGGSIEAQKSYGMMNNSTGTINIQDGTIIAQTSCALYNKVEGNIKITGGMIKSAGDIAVDNQGNGEIIVENGELIAGMNVLSNRAGGVIRMKGGTISGIGTNYPAIYNAKEGNIEITGGTITSKQSSAIYNNLGGTIKILGGTINSVGSIGVSNQGSGEIIIENCKLIAAINAVKNAAGGTIRVTGGTLESKTNFTIYNVSTGNVTMTAGTVTSQAASALANGGTGSITVTGGTIKTLKGNALSNIGAGTITIGSASSPISTSNPSLSSDENTVYNVKGTFNFYNGILYGKNLTRYGTTNNVRSGATIVSSTSGDYKVEYFK